jgi:hypothetical protein
MITKHISIDEEYLEKLKPYIDKYSGNLGAIIRDMIKEVEKDNKNTISIYQPLFDWMIKETEGRIIPDNLIDEFIDPNLINSIDNLKSFVNDKFNKLKWNIVIDMNSDLNYIPSYINLEVRGSSPKINVVSNILSAYLIKNSARNSNEIPLGIEFVIRLNELIRVRFSRMNKYKSTESLILYFGYMDNILKTLKDRYSFWKSIVSQHMNGMYNMVTIHRSYFEDLLADNIPNSDIMLDIISRKPMQEIPLCEFLTHIKDIYENSRIVDSVDIQNNDIIVNHCYRNKKSIEKLKKIISNLLENGGHQYESKLTSNSIIFRYKPDMDIKINQIINSLKETNNGFDQELLFFLILLKGIENSNDDNPFMSSFDSLSKNTGRSLIQEYEKENNINHDQWDLEKFKKFLQHLDVKLQRGGSDIEIDNNSGSYIIKKCGLVKNNGDNNYRICSAMLGLMREALNYTLGNSFLDITRHVDNNFCEVVFKINK